MRKLLLMTISGLLSLGVAGMIPAEPSASFDPAPPPKQKGEPDKKGEPKPGGDLRKAYDLLRRIKTDDGPAGRSDERLRDWTDRASKIYRKAVAAQTGGDPREARELGTAAHDLARAVDHVRNASRFDRPDPDLPPPPEGPGPGGDGERTRRDLRRAYDRIEEADDEGPDAKYYLDGARDLYNAARRDAENDRNERAGELARAAEALTHVPEHLAMAADPKSAEGPRRKRERPEPPKAKKGERPEPKEKRGERPEPPKAKKGERPDDDALPPPLSPRH